MLVTVRGVVDAAAPVEMRAADTAEMAVPAGVRRLVIL